MYANYKKNHFPRLLQDPLVSEEDKRKIRDLLQKPWNPIFADIQQQQRYPKHRKIQTLSTRIWVGLRLAILDTSINITMLTIHLTPCLQLWMG